MRRLGCEDVCEIQLQSREGEGRLGALGRLHAGCWSMEGCLRKSCVLEFLVSKAGNGEDGCLSVSVLQSQITSTTAIIPPISLNDFYGAAQRGWSRRGSRQVALGSHYGRNKQPASCTSGAHPQSLPIPHLLVATLCPSSLWEQSCLLPRREQGRNRPACLGQMVQCE